MSTPEPQSATANAIVARVSQKSKKQLGPIFDASMNDEERRDAQAVWDAKQKSVKEQIIHKKGKAESHKPTQQEAGELDAKLDEVNECIIKAVDRMDVAKAGCHNLIRTTQNFGIADADEKFKLKSDGLAAGVQAYEALEKAASKLKKLQKDAMGRMAALGWDGAIIRQAIKERKQPKQVQLELWNNIRRETDKVHDELEAKGVHRKGDDGDEKKKKGRRGK